MSLITSGSGPYGLRWVAGPEVPETPATISVAALDLDGTTIGAADVAVNEVDRFRTIRNDVTSSTVWSANDGPYIVDGTIDVAPGATLEIRPGTSVLFTADSSIVVEGLLLAEGSSGQEIEFRALECDVPWGGIALVGTGDGGNDPFHVMRHARFSGGSEPGGFDGCVAPVDAKVKIEDCTFRDIVANAIDGTDARVEVRRCTFERIFEGVHCNTSTTIVSDCVFRGMIGDRDAIDFDGEGASRSLIENCLFEDGSDDGIDLGGVTVDIRGNEFRGIQDKAISIEDPGSLGQPTIVGNLIFECGTGMAIKNGIDIQEGHHNTVVSCQEGVHFFAKDAAPDGGHGAFHSMIVWNNSSDVIIDDVSSATFEFSNIGGRDIFPGAGNLRVDPRFEDLSSGDLDLQEDSPCRATGRGGTDMGARPFGGVVPTKSFIRGDSNASGAVDISDPINILGFLFQGRPGPTCPDSADGNDDGVVDISDAIFVLRFLFLAGAPIPVPYPDEGIDPTPDELLCP